jgi:hypothetical protein
MRAEEPEESAEAAGAEQEAKAEEAETAGAAA